MSTYTIDVSKNGKFLFRTAEQPGDSRDEEVEKVIFEISSRFLKKDGYKVEYVEWPSLSGVISNVTQ